MKGWLAEIMTALVVIATSGSACCADTFTHRLTDEILHGYATSGTQDANTIVHTRQKGPVKLNLTYWRITSDPLGRNNKVFVLTLDNTIMLKIETDALIDALTEASDQGPLFILLVIDTPGGRVDYTRRICGTIARAVSCPVIAHIIGRKYGGAISAGAAVAFACDKIYMANNTVIGASAPMALSGTGPKDFRKIYGEEIGEKISSAWRAYLASLAEQNHRPRLLAAAMVDKDLDVVEVAEADKRLFIDPVNKTRDQQLVHTWSKKGSLLTLTAEEAVQCGIADKVVNSRQELLRLLKVENAEIVIDASFQNATKQFKRAKLRFNKLSKSLDLKIKQMKQAQTRHRALKLLRDIKKEYKAMLTLARRYPDLKVNIPLLQQQLNSAEVLYKETKTRL
jgi:membrane-bound ClpP family serine protease